MNKNSVIDHRTKSHVKPVRHAEIEGIPMGIFEDGTPYLTTKGLARVCGVDSSVLTRLASDWEIERNRPRGIRISELLYSQGFNRENLHVVILIKGQKTYGYTDDVCMAVLEYYAFDSPKGSNETAFANYRVLARQTLRTFIYNNVGYDPDNKIPETWKHYHDRLILNDLPRGYFSVFREIADIVIYAMQKELIVDAHTLPDISVGRIWSKYWKNNGLEKKYGKTLKYPHAYPDYFPQSKSNPQNICIYPLKGLGEFRIWMQEFYLPKNFPDYLQKKMKQDFLFNSHLSLFI